MEKTFTLHDVQLYLLEINFLEKKFSSKVHHADGPSQSTIQNLLRYSSALNVMKTSAAGHIYQLTN